MMKEMFIAMEYIKQKDNPPYARLWSGIPNSLSGRHGIACRKSPHLSLKMTFFNVSNRHIKRFKVRIILQ